MSIRIHRPVLLLAAIPALLLAACSGILTSEQAAKQYYLLTPLEAAAGGAAAETPMEMHLTVTAVPGLDTDRILALGTDARLNRYSNARWPDYLPEVLTSVLRRSLEATGRYDMRANAGGDGDRGSLRLEVRQFYGLQDAAGDTRSVAVELAGSLVCESRDQPVNLKASSPVAEQRLAAVVAAHQAALDSVTRDLLEMLEHDCGG